MQLERRIWYPNVDHPVIQRTKDEGPYTKWPAPEPGWDTIEIVRRKSYQPWIAIVGGIYIFVLSMLVLIGVAHYPLWVQVGNGAAIGLFVMAWGGDRLIRGEKIRESRNPTRNHQGLPPDSGTVAKLPRRPS